MHSIINILKNICLYWSNFVIVGVLSFDANSVHISLLYFIFANLIQNYYLLPFTYVHHYIDYYSLKPNTALFMICLRTKTWYNSNHSGLIYIKNLGEFWIYHLSFNFLINISEEAMGKFDHASRYAFHMLKSTCQKIIRKVLMVMN